MNRVLERDPTPEEFWEEMFPLGINRNTQKEKEIILIDESNTKKKTNAR